MSLGGGIMIQQIKLLQPIADKHQIFRKFFHLNNEYNHSAWFQAFVMTERKNSKWNSTMDFKHQKNFKHVFVVFLVLLLFFHYRTQSQLIIGRITIVYSSIASGDCMVDMAFRTQCTSVAAIIFACGDIRATLTTTFAGI